MFCTHPLCQDRRQNATVAVENTGYSAEAAAAVAAGGVLVDGTNWNDRSNDI